MKKKTPINTLNVALLLLASVGVGTWIWERHFAAKVLFAAKPAVVVVAQIPLEVPKEPFLPEEMAVYQSILVSSSTGDFVGTQKKIEHELTITTISVPFLGWLTAQLPLALTSVAWMKIKTQECDDAVKILYRVLSLAAIPEAQKGLGYCLRITKNWPEAAGYLTLYIMAKPADVEGRLIYADTLESLGRYDEAVAILEGAMTQSGIDQETKEILTERLATMRAKSKTSLRQKTEHSEHFFVSYREQDHEGILQDVLDILEDAVDEYSEILGIATPGVPIEVILYRKEDFMEVFAGGPAWVEGLFDGRLRVPVSAEMLKDVKGKLATILRHELSHAMLALRSNGRTWPIWFDEGLAQYLSCRKRACDGFAFPATPGTFNSISVLTQPFVSLDTIEAGRAYLHSLYMVRSLVQSKGEPIIDFISSKVPATGAVTSDFIAINAGWDSFAEMHADVLLWWNKRERK